MAAQPLATLAKDISVPAGRETMELSESLMGLKLSLSKPTPPSRLLISLSLGTR